MIICGYAGIGKSYLAEHFPNVMDLESTPFEKDWERYAKCAIHYHKQGRLVLTSCHLELREQLCNMLDWRQERLLTLFPAIEDKEIYRKRYEERGNTPEFIKIQMDNWEKWHKHNGLHGEWLRRLKSGGETLYDYIIRMSNKPDVACYYCSYDGCPVPEQDKPYCKNPFEPYLNKWNV